VPSVQCIIARFQAVAHASGNPGCRNTPSDPVSCRLHPRQQGISAADARRYTPMQCAGLKTADYSLDLDARLAEIEQQAQVQPGCRQVIDALGMCALSSARTAFSSTTMVSSTSKSVNYRRLRYRRNGQQSLAAARPPASLAQFMGQGIFINLLRETGTEPIHDPKRAADNHPRKATHPGNIGVHLLTSAAKIPYLR
jgi:hypothetical protein